MGIYGSVTKMECSFFILHKKKKYKSIVYPYHVVARIDESEMGMML